MFVEAGCPDVNLIIFDGEIRAKAEVYELIVVLPENIHDAIEHIEVVPLRIVDGVGINHAVVVHSSEGMRQGLSVDKRTVQDSRCNADPMRLTFRYRRAYRTRSFFSPHKTLRHAILWDASIEYCDSQFRV